MSLAMERVTKSSVMDDQVQGHFLNLYAMALADLTLDPGELKLLFEFGERRGIEREEIEHLLLNPHTVEASIPLDVVDRIRCLYDFALMVWSDDRVDPLEKELMERFCVAFEFDDANVAQITGFLLAEAEKCTPVDEVLSIVRQSMEVDG